MGLSGLLVTRSVSGMFLNWKKQVLELNRGTALSAQATGGEARSKVTKYG